MIGVIIALLKIYEILVIIRAVMSWFRLDERAPWARLLIAVTDPVLSPFRPIARLGAVDLSPVVVILLIELIIRFIR